MGKIKCSLCFKKKRAKKFIFAPEIALRVEHSNMAQNPNFRADFLNARFQCSRLFHICGKFLQLNGRARG
jgi:hypothetical protein